MHAERLLRPGSFAQELDRALERQLVGRQVLGQRGARAFALLEIRPIAADPDDDRLFALGVPIAIVHTSARRPRRLCSRAAL